MKLSHRALSCRTHPPQECQTFTPPSHPSSSFRGRHRRNPESCRSHRNLERGTTLRAPTWRFRARRFGAPEGRKGGNRNEGQCSSGPSSGLIVPGCARFSFRARLDQLRPGFIRAPLRFRRKVSGRPTTPSEHWLSQLRNQELL
jgi:hypothetical protein